MNVSELMTRDPKTCSKSDNLARAAQVMWEHDCGVVPVVDAQGTLVGVVTDRDACMAGYTQGQTLETIPIERSMSRQVYTVQPDATVAHAIELMTRHAVRRLPVVDGAGRLVGLVSIADVARAARLGRGVAESDLLRLVEGVSRSRHAAAVDVLVPAPRPLSATPKDLAAEPKSAAKPASKGHSKRR